LPAEEDEVFQAKAALFVNQPIKVGATGTDNNADACIIAEVLSQFDERGDVVLQLIGNAAANALGNVPKVTLIEKN
jgi:hypothetical protein